MKSNTVVESNYKYYSTFILLLHPLQKHIASTENSCIHWINNSDIYFYMLSQSNIIGH